MRRLKQLRTYEVALDKVGFGPVAGVDEAGRGACFGPVTIAACMLPTRPLPELEGLDDSKKLTERRRRLLFDAIVNSATAFSIVHVPAADIDRRGIQAANLDGARRAVAGLDPAPKYVLMDGFRIPGLGVPQLPVVGGDAAARCIAAASVLAKVSRDALIVEMAEQFPEYGLAGHKGYSTAAHMAAVRRHGASAQHRYSYANVREADEFYKGVVR
ncbi:ribonuclease HII [Corynebacterium riegelii]|uniref:ribonuclease HII n=1 Tax=Corynebacterium riegelii TaxID=156976 RepID=UPI000690E287|nr:ribonuclease HII [Corynebacterium riegelii]MDK7179300.1 ribonuclease HII [Corynebacterium riegelii]PLA13214.1 ribonuclease HII [Corynebacterium riegelii]QQU83813.1 ribonuclease HII [Corynebacterium riegelii]